MITIGSFLTTFELRNVFGTINVINKNGPNAKPVYQVRLVQMPDTRSIHVPPVVRVGVIISAIFRS